MVAVSVRVKSSGDKVLMNASTIRGLKHEMAEKEGYPIKKQFYHDTQGKCLKDDHILEDGEELDLTFHLRGGCDVGCGCCGNGCDICCVIL